MGSIVQIKLWVSIMAKRQTREIMGISSIKRNFMIIHISK